MVKVGRLTKAAAEPRLRELLAELGQTDRDRVDALLPLVSDSGEIVYGAALRTLFPGKTVKDAQGLFRQFRDHLRQAAREAGQTIVLVVDSAKKTPPDQRRGWFEGADRAVETVVDFSDSMTDAVEPDPVLVPDSSPPSSITRRARQDVVVATADRLAAEGKRPIRCFVSYARDDTRLKDDLLKRLRSRLQGVRDYRIIEWQDLDIQAGQDWHAEIQAAIEACDFGLLLISPAFLASPYIRQHEMPHFVPDDPFEPTPRRRAVPVALRALDFDHADLKGLKARQIFHDRDRKAFVERTSEPTKDRFAEDLTGNIMAMLDGHFAAAVPPDAANQAARDEEAASRPFPPDLEAEARRYPQLKNYVPGLAARTDSRKSLTDGAEPAPEERGDSLQLLTEWAADPAAPPCCALFGEFGIGKTTAVMALTQVLLHARETDPGVRLPIYLDLRLAGDARDGQVGLLDLIDNVLARSWRGGVTDERPTAREVVRLVQTEGALVIYDGLDEVLVNLSPNAGKLFTRELLRILPPALWPGRRKSRQTGTPGRIRITCRTHFFRTLRDQQTHMTAEDRDNVRAEDFRTFLLLPFTDRQVREYLTLSLGPERAAEGWELIRSVHNLPEMAERPYTLNLIADRIPDLAAWAAQGRVITGATLYRHMVLSCLERDSGKHQITPDHKLLLMEGLAAELHRAGRRSWSAGEAEQWLLDVLAARPDLGLHYTTKDRELLKEDLRTATFLVREGDEEFRFAHSSLQEFFLASHLRRALVDGRFAAWDMPEPSRETVEFLGQLLMAEPSDAASATLRAMRGAYRPRISELAFRYGLLAVRRGYPGISLAGSVLDGADLRGWDIGWDPEPGGRSDPGTAGVAPPVNLRGASFRRARLEGATIRHADLTEADVTAATLDRALILSSRLERARLDEASLVGTAFRFSRLRDVSLVGAALHRTQFLRCQDAPRVAPGLPADAMLVAPNPRVADRAAAHIAALAGHSGGVTSCGYSPGGDRIVSGSSDNTVRVWDAGSGAPIGHRTVLLGNGEYATITAAEDRIVRATPGAWRDLGWLVPGPDGALTRLPAETFGAYPEVPR